MQYASTAIDSGIEKTVTVLPLSEVPDFDPSNPHQNTYAVSDDVQIDWVKNSDGSFSAPSTSVTPAQLKQAVINAAQGAMDIEAQTHGYYGIMSLVSYASDTQLADAFAEKCRIEGNAGKAWRTACWAALYAYQSAVLAGTTTAPQTLNDAKVAGLTVVPQMVWPE